VSLIYRPHPDIAAFAAAHNFKIAYSREIIKIVLCDAQSVVPNGSPGSAKPRHAVDQIGVGQPVDRPERRAIATKNPAVPAKVARHRNNSRAGRADRVAGCRE
jgi:hypothetical protein